MQPKLPAYVKNQGITSYDFLWVTATNSTLQMAIIQHTIKLVFSLTIQAVCDIINQSMGIKYFNKLSTLSSSVMLKSQNDRINKQITDFIAKYNRLYGSGQLAEYNQCNKAVAHLLRNHCVQRWLINNPNASTWWETVELPMAENSSNRNITRECILACIRQKREECLEAIFWGQSLEAILEKERTNNSIIRTAAQESNGALFEMVLEEYLSYRFKQNQLHAMLQRLKPFQEVVACQFKLTFYTALQTYFEDYQKSPNEATLDRVKSIYKADLNSSTRKQLQHAICSRLKKQGVTNYPSLEKAILAIHDTEKEQQALNELQKIIKDTESELDALKRPAEVSVKMQQAAAKVAAAKAVAEKAAAAKAAAEKAAAAKAAAAKAAAEKAAATAKAAANGEATPATDSTSTKQMQDKKKPDHVDIKKSQETTIAEKIDACARGLAVVTTTNNYPTLSLINIKELLSPKNAKEIACHTKPADITYQPGQKTTAIDTDNESLILSQTDCTTLWNLYNQHVKDEPTRKAKEAQQLLDKKRQADAEAQRAKEEAQRTEAEAQRAEAEAQRAEAEAQRTEAEAQRAETDAQRVAEEEKRAAEEKKRAAEEKKRAAEEKKRAAEEKKRAAEEKKRAAEEKKRAAEEKKRAAEEKKRAVEAQRAVEEEKRAAEEEKRAVEEEKRAVEEQRVEEVESTIQAPPTAKSFTQPKINPTISSVIVQPKTAMAASIAAAPLISSSILVLLVTSSIIDAGVAICFGCLLAAWCITATTYLSVSIFKEYTSTKNNQNIHTSNML